MTIPFDNLTAAAVADEAQALVGATLERVWTPHARTYIFGFYGEGERWLKFQLDPPRILAHLLTRRPEGPRGAGPFADAIVQRLIGSPLLSVEARGGDRIFDLAFPEHILVAELTGRFANLLLLDASQTVVAADQWLGAARSVRPVIPKQPYVPPPGAPTLGAVRPGSPVPSPFLARLLVAGLDPSDVDRAWGGGDWHPVYVPGSGAYPIVAIAGGIPRSSISQALEQSSGEAELVAEMTAARASLAGQLSRVRLAREVALRDVDEAIGTGGKAAQLQLQAELLLAFAAQVPTGSDEVWLDDYEGRSLRITLNPELDAIANARAKFDRAKRAKAGLGHVTEQRERLTADLVRLHEAETRLKVADTLDAIEELRKDADSRNWLHRGGAALAKQERRFEGFPVREAVAPAGWRVLYGTNATSNDYVTHRIAKPGDLWFHVRGASSSHVVLCCHGRTASVQMPDMMFAAQIAVRESNAKHSKYVTVDMVEKRHVSKPRGAQPGTAVYRNERTLHVDLG